MRRKLVLFLFFLLFLPGLASAKSDAKDIMRDLLQIGLQAVEQGASAEQTASEAADQTTPGRQPQKVASTAASALTRSVRASLESVLDSVKERYKEEGKVYARQIGDLLAERVAHNPRIQTTITTLQTLCWALVIYLTLVSLALLIGMRRLSKRNREILLLLRELSNSKRSADKT